MGETLSHLFFMLGEGTVRLSEEDGVKRWMLPHP